MLETINRNATLQLQLIDDILEMSAIMRGKVVLDMQRVDLGRILSLAVDSLIPAITAKGLILTCEIGDQTAAADGDPRRLHQVFSNMLSNAIKFTPTDGRISIALRTEGDDHVIVLSDTGAGIPSDFLPHVFEQFSQADRGRTSQHGGLGLGLSIAHFLIGEHQGTIEVESPGLNQGTTVRVRLPRATNVDR